MRVLKASLEGRVQEVRIGSPCLEGLPELVSERGSTSGVLIVSDTNVAPLYAGPIQLSIRASGVPCNLATIPAGENAKTLERAAELYGQLAHMRLGRDGLVIAVGGGVMGDLAGFVAATWLRGVELILCPTSLEAAIDAAIGGKTGVNHPAGKNLIGAFHPASHVLIDPQCLQTLPRRDVVAGIAESIKHALIADEAFFSWHEAQKDALLAGDPATIEELIARNVQIKLDLVSRDYRERAGERARLNFGHTLGHAIEASCAYALRHGECVSLGMVGAARISCSMGSLGQRDFERIEALLRSFGLPVRYSRLAGEETLRGYLENDKKTAAARTRWVLLAGIGRTIIRDDVSEDLVRESIDFLRS